tara:strand:+ start:10060 stop:11106 length:1047 start_codon:yes stop_codon:yes gene_type:complete
MCVIMEFTDTYPTKEILDSASTTNRDGGGMAWIDDAKGVTRWEKGMHVNTEFILETIEKENIQLPIVIHFRIATHGAVDSPLCHPFALSEGNDDLSSSGSDVNGVLFHNGVWADYSDYALKVAMTTPNAKIPNGDLSDSRVMAWLVRYLGVNYLSMIDEKILVLTPQGILKFNDWTKVKMKVDKSVNEKEEVEVSCSNDYFDSKYSYGGSDSGLTTVYGDEDEEYLTDCYTDGYSHKLWQSEKKSDFQVASQMDGEVEEERLSNQRKREAMDDLEALNLNATNLEIGITGDIENDLDEYETEYFKQQKNKEEVEERLKSSLEKQKDLGEWAMIGGQYYKIKALEDKKE